MGKRVGESREEEEEEKGEEREIRSVNWRHFLGYLTTRDAFAGGHQVALSLRKGL